MKNCYKVIIKHESTAYTLAGETELLILADSKEEAAECIDNTNLVNASIASIVEDGTW